MEQLISAFGIDLKLITIQVINFVVLLGLLGYFLYRPILNLLAEREEKVAQGIRDAEAAAAARADADKEKRDIVQKAHQEASEVAARATKHADERAAEIVSGAEGKATDIVTQAEEKSRALKDRAVAESEAEVAKLAVLAAEKILRERARS